jgi:hypothetical protein
MSSADVKWVEELPAPERKSNMTRIYPDLIANPGRWAEIQRYTGNSGRVYSRAMQYVAKHPEIEYAVRRVGEQWVLFMRATDKESK